MNKNNFTIIIPSRFGSTRMPGKSLLDINGKTMIQRVFEQCKKSNAQQTIIATDDVRIKEAADIFNANTQLTSVEHLSGTDRIFEVARNLELDDDHIIVNVQGDEPLIPPSIINQVANNMATIPSIHIATLCVEINDIDDFINPNVVKVKRDINNISQLFSRAPIPFNKNWKSLLELSESNSKNTKYILGFRHIGIYAYTYKSLKDFVSFHQTQSETTESLEQMRALDNGMKIHCDIASDAPPSGIDTQEDLLKVRSYLEEQNS